MNDYVILTDSASDITDVQSKEWNTPIISMSYLLDNKLFVNNPDHSEFPIPEFYKTLKAGAKVSTSAINIGDFVDFFTPFLNEGKDILYVCFSSGLSATYQNAINASKELSESFPERRVEIVDSLCASFGQGMLVYLCSQKKKEGATLDEVIAYAEEIKHNICHEFTVDDLGQLKRGGRISAVAAIFGSVLQIKPMLFVDKNGKLAAYDKVRSRNSSIRKMTEMALGEARADSPIFVSHGDCDDDVNTVVSIIKEARPDQEVIINYIGPVIGAHSGHKTIAVYCIGQGRGDARLKK
ncbi:MAG: DegV family protein [Clostridia bacterium]|nr:DegV family protein [Clostridia bacterium]